VQTFSNFIEWHDGLPNVYAIVSRIGRRDTRISTKDLDLPHPSYLGEFYRRVWAHCQNANNDDQIRLSFEDFHSFLYALHTGYFLPVFQNSTERIRPFLLPTEISELNAARENYAYELRRYVEFLTELNGSLHQKVMPTPLDPPRAI
jgi:hypothetical protein